MKSIERKHRQLDIKFNNMFANKSPKLLASEIDLTSALMRGDQVGDLFMYANHVVEVFKQQFKEATGIVSPDIKQVEDTIVYTKECSVANEPYSITISVEEYNRINISRESVQSVLPHKTIEERDFIITGFTPKEMKEMFK